MWQEFFFPPFKAKWYCIVCVSHFLTYFICQWKLGFLDVLAVVNNAAMNTGIQTSLRYPAFNSLGEVPKSGVVGSYGNSVFQFLREHRAVFHAAVPYSVPTVSACGLRFFPHPHRHRLFSAFLIVAIPVGMRWSDPASFYTALYLRSCRTAEHIEVWTTGWNGKQNQRKNWIALKILQICQNWQLFYIFWRFLQ